MTLGYMQVEVFLAIFVESYANAVGGVSKGPVRLLLRQSLAVGCRVGGRGGRQT